MFDKPLLSFYCVVTFQRRNRLRRVSSSQDSLRQDCSMHYLCQARLRVALSQRLVNILLQRMALTNPKGLFPLARVAGTPSLILHPSDDIDSSSASFWLPLSISKLNDKTLKPECTLWKMPLRLHTLDTPKSHIPFSRRNTRMSSPTRNSLHHHHLHRRSLSGRLGRSRQPVSQMPWAFFA